MKVETKRIQHKCNNCGCANCINMHIKFYEIEFNKFYTYKYRCNICGLSTAEYGTQETAAEHWFKELIRRGADR